MHKINNSFGNNNKINNGTLEKSNYVLKTKLIIDFDFINRESNINMKLIDLKNIINSKFNIQEYEYELFLDEKSINNFPNETLIVDLLNKYNATKIIIKSYKNILDVQNQINSYEKLLIKNISLKDDEIKLLNNEYENIKNDLNNL